MPRCIVCDVCTTAPSILLDEGATLTRFITDDDGKEYCNHCWYEDKFHEDIMDGLLQDADKGDCDREDPVPELQDTGNGQQQGQSSDIPNA